MAHVAMKRRGSFVAVASAIANQNLSHAPAKNKGPAQSRRAPADDDHLIAVHGKRSRLTEMSALFRKSTDVVCDGSVGASEIPNQHDTGHESKDDRDD